MNKRTRSVAKAAAILALFIVAAFGAAASETSDRANSYNTAKHSGEMAEFASADSYYATASVCTASCPGGSVECIGFGCQANDGFGCMSWTSRFRVVEHRTCDEATLG